MARPLFCAWCTLLFSAMFHPYPTLGDAAAHLALLPLFARQLCGMRSAFLVASGYVYVMLLSPIFWHLWIHARVANANFFFAITLAYTATQSILAVGCVTSTLAHDRRVKLALAAKRE
jgi:phosphatidylinositol glycan class U